MSEIALTVVCGSAVGLALGLTGGGGSLFAMPLLIYVLGLRAAVAVPVSLAAVAMTALIGAVHAARARLPVWPAAAAFGLGGIIGAPAGITFARDLDSRIIVAGFAGLALAAGSMMWWRSLTRPQDAGAVRVLPAGSSGVCDLADDGRLRFSAPCAAVLALAGLGTGVLSGVFGVGGGFVIVPALSAVTRMGIHRAIATSLVALSAISLAGAASAVFQRTLAWSVLLPFVAGGGAGMAAGRILAARVAGPRLQRLFATAVVLVAILMAIRIAVG